MKVSSKSTILNMPSSYEPKSGDLVYSERTGIIYLVKHRLNEDLFAVTVMGDINCVYRNVGLTTILCVEAMRPFYGEITIKSEPYMH